MQLRYFTAIYARYRVAPEAGETFWGVVWRCHLPIAITEGFKKAYVPD